MFIYLVAVVATIFLIFGLLHGGYLNDWMQSSIRYSLTLYNGIICRPVVGAPSNNEDLVNSLSERPVTLISDGVEFADHPTTRTAINYRDRLMEQRVEEGGGKARSMNPPRYSLEDMISEERDRDLGLTAMRNLQLGTTPNDTIRTSKQEGKENIFETLKNSIEKTSPYSSSRLNTREIYNLLLKETKKEDEARQKLLDNNKSKLSDTMPVDARDQVPSSSENKAEHEDHSI